MNDRSVFMEFDDSYVECHDVPKRRNYRNDTYFGLFTPMNNTEYLVGR